MVLFDVMIEAIGYIFSNSLLTPETYGKTTKKGKKKKAGTSPPSDDKLEKS